MKLQPKFRLVILLNFLYFFIFTPTYADENQKILRLGLHVSGMGTLDPHFAAGTQDRVVADMVFNGLLRYVPGHAPQIELDLAQKMPEFKIIDGQQIWTIHIRKGVMFHAGPMTASYELTADDVVYSLNKSRDVNRCAYSGEYVGMTFKKMDRYVVRIMVEKPLAPSLFFPKISNYSGGFIVSKKAIKAMGYKAFKKHPVGTGPFLFHSYKKGKQLKLSSNENYFRGQPKLSGIHVLFLPDVQDRMAAFNNNALDVYAGSSRKGWLATIKNQKDILIDIHGVGEAATLHFNTKTKPLDDVRVRQAIAYGLDRQAFLDTMEPQLSGPVYSPVPVQFLPGGLSKKDAKLLKLEYPLNIKKAKQLLNDAGYPNGFTLDMISSEKRAYQTYYQILKKQLKKINIVCNIKTVTHKEMHQQIRNAPKPIVIYPAWRPNADAYLTRFFHSDSIVVSGKKPDTNFSHYDQIDYLIESARIENDPKTQINLWVQAQIQILNDMAAYPLMFIRQIFIRHPYVDYGHELVSTMALYPQFTEKTTLTKTNTN